MYYAHFGLKEPPFKITPNTDFFYTGGNRGAILDALKFAIASGEGIVKVVGEVGSGKTMLCRMLQAALPDNVESVYLANPSLSPEEILHAIAFELQLAATKETNRLQVMQLLQEFLLAKHAEGKQVVIFVEEAQGMPLETLEEIRLLSNLETKQDKLLQIVLFGQPELDENLNEQHIRQLKERITHSFYLGPFDTKDIGSYIDFRLRKAGYAGPPLFTPYALRVLSQATEGLVRRANILADKALLATYAENKYQVTHKHVIAAIRDSAFDHVHIQGPSVMARLGLSLIGLFALLGVYHVMSLGFPNAFTVQGANLQSLWGAWYAPSASLEPPAIQPDKANKTVPSAGVASGGDVQGASSQAVNSQVSPSSSVDTMPGQQGASATVGVPVSQASSTGMTALPNTTQTSPTKALGQDGQQIIAVNPAISATPEATP